MSRMKRITAIIEKNGAGYISRPIYRLGRQLYAAPPGDEFQLLFCLPFENLNNLPIKIKGRYGAMAIPAAKL
jgi:hypothetical protein